MAQKCVHKGCGKVFSDPDEPCVYHPGPPEFHEGQKGWKCCKPRVLTFDEFLAIPPCTTGKHSTIDDTPQPEKKQTEEPPAPAREPQPQSTLPDPPPRIPQPAADASQVPTAAAAPESESDDPGVEIPNGRTCKRRGCGAVSGESSASTPCVYHPGQALFHEGSKGWTCCKKRVLEFDEFMRIPGCKTRDNHCFIGKPKKRKMGAAAAQADTSAAATSMANGVGGAGDDDEDLERLTTVRNDFYQTSTAVHASFFLKKIDKDRSRVVFRDSGSEIEMSLRTADDKLYDAVVPLYAKIAPDKSSFRILGTKLELTLAKADGVGWPVLRSDERLTGEIIQTGRAGKA